MDFVSFVLQDAPDELANVELIIHDENVVRHVQPLIYKDILGSSRKWAQ